MNVFAIADTHLSFGQNIDKPMEVFGPAWSGYEARLKENWRKVVENEDLVLIPGDISWAMHLEDAMADLAWIDALPGRKLLLRGNHDLWWSSMAKMKGIFPTIEFLQNDSFVDTEHRFAVIGSRGWLCPGDSGFTEDDLKIYNRELLRLDMSVQDMKKKLAASGLSEEEQQGFFVIAMTHFPPVSQSREETGFTDIFSAVKVKRAVYGHLHSEKAFENALRGIIGETEYMLVSADSLSFRLQLVASLK